MASQSSDLESDKPLQYLLHDIDLRWEVGHNISNSVANLYWMLSIIQTFLSAINNLPGTSTQKFENLQAVYGLTMRNWFPCISIKLFSINQLFVNQFELRQTDKSTLLTSRAQISVLIIPAYTSIKLSILTVYWHNLWISHQSHIPTWLSGLNS